ncbi:MAG: ATP-grasp domain-containing protein, partial [Crocinitomicaceae bacterium]|nr:ATP-grasp domain-containing protein [Crocinitomicaceae bacterium]
MSTTRLSFYDSDYKIGILGGGQLGRMFIQEAVNLDVNVHILDPDQSAPASKIAHHFICGSITDFNQVIEFGKDKQVVTIEIEHVNVDALEQLEKTGIKVFPQPHLIRMVQDKGLQKEFYRKHEIPTAPFKLIDNKNDLISLQEELPFVQKLRKGGYDGKGVQVMRTIADFDKGFDAPSVIEEMIEFEKELSVIVARNEHGETKAYPAVELVFNPEANLVEYLFSPADITSETEEKARKIALDLIKKMNLVGILAVEMFLTKSGEI